MDFEYAKCKHCGHRQRISEYNYKYWWTCCKCHKKTEGGVWDS